MIRYLLLMLTGISLLFVVGTADVQAQNIFRSPNKSKSDDSKNSMPSFVVPKNKSSNTSKKSKNIYTQQKPQKKSIASLGKHVDPSKMKVTMNTKGFDVYKDLKGLDPALLQAGGRVPQSRDEAIKLMAAQNIGLVTNVLAMKPDIETTALGQAALAFNDSYKQAEAMIKKYQGQINKFKDKYRQFKP